MNVETTGKTGKSGSTAAPSPLAMDWGLLETSIGCLIRLLRNELTPRIVEALEAFDMHSGAHTTMWLISSNPGCSQTDLAREMAIDDSALVTILDDLESRGLAVRVRSKTDRRRNDLFLTDEGEALKMAMYRQTSAVEAQMLADLTEEERTALHRFLGQAYLTIKR